MEFFKPTLRRKDMDAVLQTMVDEKIGPGERRKDFLRQAAFRLGLKGGVSERSYPQALVKALKAVGVKEGDQVIASVLSPEIYKSVVESLGASLLLCDVSAEDGCLSLESVSRAFEKGGSAILLHEPIGQIPTSLDGVRDLRLPIVEDISQSFGSRIIDEDAAVAQEEDDKAKEEEPVVKYKYAPGRLGDIVVSAFEEDCVVSTGGGALCLSRNEELIDSLKRLGAPFSPYNELPDMNAALGIIQLAGLDSMLARRDELYRMFMQSIMKTENKVFGLRSVDFRSNGYAFPVIVNGRPEESIDFAKKHGVVCRRSFTKSVGIHYQERFDLFPNAVAALNRGLSFPLYPFLSQKDTEALNKVLSHLP